jgi:hypothetical protein
LSAPTNPLRSRRRRTVEVLMFVSFCAAFLFTVAVALGVLTR